MNVSDVSLGTRNVWTAAMFLGTVLLPAAAILSLLFAIDAWRRGAGRWLSAYAARRVAVRGRAHGIPRRTGA